MDIIIKTKKREISLLKIMGIIISIPLYLVMIIILLVTFILGVFAWIDLFDGGGWIWWEYGLQQGLFLNIVSTIIFMGFTLLIIVALIVGIVKGGQFFLLRLKSWVSKLNFL